MNKLRNFIAAAAATITLSVAALTPASAHFHGGHGGFGHFHSHFRFHERSRMGSHAHWRHGWRHRWCFRGRCGRRFGWGSRYHFHYRVASGESAVAAPRGVGPPAGFHLGYLGKHCWPNRN